MKPLITVIMPVYNAGAAIGDCIDSILKSSYEDLEILVIDDGSDDETRSLCDRVKELDSRIQVIHQKNSGVSAARNKGIELAKGKYITFVDADDFIDHDLIECLVREAEKNKADVVICGYRECYKDGTFKERFCNKTIRVKYKKEILPEFFVTNNIGWNVWAKLYKKSAVDSIQFRVGMRIAEDMFFNYEVLKEAAVIVEYGFPGYNYIKHENSVMSSCDCSKFFDSFYLTKEVFEDIVTNHEYKDEKLYFYIKNELFFFRYIYAKNKNKEDGKKIEIARRVFLNTLPDEKIECGKRMKIEVFLLKYFKSIFKVFAKCYWKSRSKYKLKGFKRKNWG